MTVLALAGGRGTARDSLVGGAWTAVSRATGVVRVVVIGAVLGPTYFGNTYQLTNSLPNLLYYGFLAGSLFSSLLVPVLVQHIDRGRTDLTERVSGGFLGVALAALAVAAPLAVILFPLLMQVASLGASAPASDEQLALARWLVAMTVPQVFLYAVAGTCAALMNAHRRFALAGAAPAVENLGVIAVLLLAALLYGTDHHDVASQPTGEVLLLGLGSTAAVAAHALLQWCGARRLGVTVRPRAFWHDPEVARVVRRALRSVAQAGLLATQVLVVLVLANREPGGTVALQIALNFYYLPVALVATPVAIALLPRLSRLRDEGAQADAFSDTVLCGVRLAFFLTVPAAVGYILVAHPLARMVAVGQMATGRGVGMVAAALVALACGIVGQSTFLVATQAAYARGDTRTPLLAMLAQAVLCLALCGLVVATGTGPVVVALAGSYATASLMGGAYLYLRISRRITVDHRRLTAALGRTVAGALLMVPPVLAAVRVADSHVPGRAGAALALVVGSSAGVLTFVAVQALLRSDELSWLRGALRRRPASRPA